MFKHSKKEYDTEHDPEHDETDCIIDAVETISLSGVNEEDLVDDDENDDEIDVTFNNPSQITNKTSEQSFRCEKCDFAAERISELIDHKGQNHNWCCFCLSSFKSQDILHTVKTRHWEMKSPSYYHEKTFLLAQFVFHYLNKEGNSLQAGKPKLFSALFCACRESFSHKEGLLYPLKMLLK